VRALVIEKRVQNNLVRLTACSSYQLYNIPTKPWIYHTEFRSSKTPTCMARCPVRRSQLRNFGVACGGGAQQGRAGRFWDGWDKSGIDEHPRLLFAEALEQRSHPYIAFTGCLNVIILLAIPKPPVAESNHPKR